MDRKYPKAIFENWSIQIVKTMVALTKQEACKSLSSVTFVGKIYLDKRSQKRIRRIVDGARSSAFTLSEFHKSGNEFCVCRADARHISLLTLWFLSLFPGWCILPRWLLTTCLPKVAFGSFLFLFSWMPLHSVNPYMFHCFIESWFWGLLSWCCPCQFFSQSGETPRCAQARWETLQHVLGLPFGPHPTGHARNTSPVQKKSKINCRDTLAGFCGSGST